MKRFQSAAMFLCICVLITGCQKRSIVPDEAVTAKVEKSEPATSKENDAYSETRHDDIVDIPEVDKGHDIIPPIGLDDSVDFKDVLFDFDRYDINDYYRIRLKKTARWLSDHRDILIQIEGHCDERGSDAYNLALGDRRASSVKKYLESFGIHSSRISAITYGEEKPVCSESEESCWQRNRRADIVLSPVLP